MPKVAKFNQFDSNYTIISLTCWLWKVFFINIHLHTVYPNQPNYTITEESTILFQTIKIFIALVEQFSYSFIIYSLTVEFEKNINVRYTKCFLKSFHY